ncbi:MAG: phosphotransferase [Polyangiaceae bacterium]|nr:phosphotransferase [Polyangiaceae bacterium]MCW5791029.1 phosphotransferase [Polyangiaceae bacterium]
MHVREMREREPYEAVLRESLTAGLTDYSGQPQRVTLLGARDEALDGQRWWYQPLFSAYHADRPTRAVRAWLKDSLRYTEVRWRIAPQLAVGTLAGARLGLRALGQPGFSISPGISAPEASVLLPGNQRVRLLCFATRRTRSFIKAGFSREGLTREIAARSARQGVAPAPFAPILDHGPDWIEEELLSGVVLARLPPWRRRQPALGRLLTALDAWSRSEQRPCTGLERAEQLVSLASQLEAAVRERYAFEGLPERALARLAEEASALGSLELTRTHGDLQPGNVLVRPSGEMTLLDWEHSAERVWFYDRLVLGLRSRAPGWRSAAPAFLSGASVFPFDTLPREAAWRRRALALFQLEEAVWYLREALSGRYLRAPQGLIHCARGLAGEYRGAAYRGAGAG